MFVPSLWNFLMHYFIRVINARASVFTILDISLQLTALHFQSKDTTLIFVNMLFVLSKNFLTNNFPFFNCYYNYLQK